METRLRVVVLLNASAGTLEARGGENLGDAVASAFEHHGIAATLEVLPGPDLQAAAERAVQRVREQELDALVVGGGDGSIRTVAHVLAGTGVPLGILPLGTLNHFARDLGIPADLKEAVALIAAGKKPVLSMWVRSTERPSSTILPLDSTRIWFLNGSGSGADKGCRSGLR
jgi:diacylglycerol kinase family enzyme